MSIYIQIVLASIIGLIILPLSMAMPLQDIQITNTIIQSIVVFSFNMPPIYHFFSLHNPERLVLDLNQGINLQHRLPLHFYGKSLIKCIRTSTPVNNNSLRFVFELTGQSYIQINIQKFSDYYNLIVTIRTLLPKVAHVKRQHNLVQLTTNSPQKFNVCLPNKDRRITFTPLVVAIDAGHGGQDPGATGPHGIQEKNITIAIAQKLNLMLKRDPLFKPVLTRDSDQFISVIGRSEVARKHKASVLISIHANAAPNHSARGASVLVLSNKRANSEITNLLDKNDKQVKLLGGAGNLLASSKTNPYFSQVILDLQFGHAQRVGYDLAVKMLQQLQDISILHKSHPVHASLGVLRSPDIPSLLIEIGFISNAKEELLLNSSAYQEKIAYALYLGLRSYFL